MLKATEMPMVDAKNPFRVLPTTNCTVDGGCSNNNGISLKVS